MNVSSKAGVEEYDLVILGGGTGGTVAAWTFAAQAACSGHRAQIHRWLVPEHRMFAQQEHHSQRESRLVLPESREFGIVNGQLQR